MEPADVNANYWGSLLSQSLSDTWNVVIEHSGESLLVVFIIAVLVHISKHGLERVRMKKALLNLLPITLITAAVYFCFFIIHFSFITSHHFYIALSGKFSESEHSLKNAMSEVSILTASNLNLTHEKDVSDMTLKVIQSTTGMTNIQLPKIAIVVDRSPVWIGNSEFVDCNYSVTNDEPLDKMVVNILIVQGDENIKSMSADNAEHIDAHLSQDNKSCSLIYFPFRSDDGDFYFYVSGPCSVRLTSVFLEKPIMIEINRTNIVAIPQ